MQIAVELLVILLLIVVNGLFSLSELALVSANRARLAVLERKGVRGAARARVLAEDPQRFLPTVQVGITLVGILTGVFGGASVAARLTPLLARLPYVGGLAASLSLALVVMAITYLHAGAGRTGAQATGAAPAGAGGGPWWPGRSPWSRA